MVTLGMVFGVILLMYPIHHHSLGQIRNFREGVLRYGPRKAVPCRGSWGHPSTKNLLKLRSSEMQFLTSWGPSFFL